MIEVGAMELGMEDATEVVYKIAEIQSHLTVVLGSLPTNDGWSKENTLAILTYVNNSLSELAAQLPIDLATFNEISDEVFHSIANSYSDKPTH